MGTLMVHSQNTHDEGKHYLPAFKRTNMSRDAQAKDVNFPEVFPTQISIFNNIYLLVNFLNILKINKMCSSDVTAFSLSTQPKFLTASLP